MAVEKEIEAGNKLRENKQLDEALVHYNNALKENPKAFKAHYEKSIALQRLKRFDEALLALNHAKNIAISRGKRDLIGDVLFRLATLHFTKDDVPLASKFLITSLQYGHDSNEVGLWKSQLKNKAQKLKQDYDPEAKFTSLDELPDYAVSEAKVEEITDNGDQEHKKDDSDIAKEKLELEEKMKNKDNLYPTTKNIRRDWFQSNSSITVSIFIKNLPKDDSLKVDISSRSVNIEFPTSASSEYQYEISPLYAPINVADSSYKVFSTKIELYLTKKEPYKWATLEGSDDQDTTITQRVMPTDTTENSALQYPSSSKKHINWDQLSLDDDEDAGAKDENAFFQELYKNADEDTQRAMMKSYIESNGTALSTNWEEVSKKKVETSPPEGLVAKQW